MPDGEMSEVVSRKVYWKSCDCSATGISDKNSNFFDVFNLPCWLDASKFRISQPRLSIMDEFQETIVISSRTYRRIRCISKFLQFHFEPSLVTCAGQEICTRTKDLAIFCEVQCPPHLTGEIISRPRYDRQAF